MRQWLRRWLGVAAVEARLNEQDRERPEMERRTEVTTERLHEISQRIEGMANDLDSVSMLLKEQDKDLRTISDEVERRRLELLQVQQHQKRDIETIETAIEALVERLDTVRREARVRSG